MTPELHQSLLTVIDLSESRDFYERIVGLEPAIVDDGTVEYGTAGWTLVLETDFPDEVREEFGLRRPGDDRGRGAIVAIEVDTRADLDRVHDRATAAGIDVRLAPRDVSWGRRLGLFADPDGYTIEVSTPLP